MKWLLLSFYDSMASCIICNILFLKANKIEFVPESLDQFFSLSSRITNVKRESATEVLGAHGNVFEILYENQL